MKRGSTLKMIILKGPVCNFRCLLSKYMFHIHKLDLFQTYFQSSKLILTALTKVKRILPPKMAMTGIAKWRLWRGSTYSCMKKRTFSKVTMNNSTTKENICEWTTYILDINYLKNCIT